MARRSSSMDELIQCSICLERFTQPKVLPCQHTFCQSCVKGIVKDGKNVDCPICRKPYKVPKGGVNGFPDNLMAIKLLSMIGESTACNDCGEKGILSECDHCQKEVCMECQSTHYQLVEEISALIESLEEGVLTRVDEKIVETARSGLKNTCDLDASIHEAVDRAIEALEARREEMLYQVKLLAMAQKAASDGDQPKAVAEQIREKLSECLKATDLKATKTCLSCVEGLLEGNEVVEFSYDLCGQVAFGSLTCGGENITRGPEKSKKVKVQFEYSTATACTEEDKCPVARLPTDIAPLSCDDLEPMSAVYSSQENVVYCLTSTGIVSMFDLDIESRRSRKISSLFKTAAMTMTETGRLILVDSLEILKFQCGSLNQLDERTILKIYQGMTLDSENNGSQALRVNIPQPVQVCSYGEEFIILDAGKLSVMKFDGYHGKFCCQFRSEKFGVNENSRMCVDFEGRVYVTGVRIKERKDTAARSQSCPRCDFSIPKSATVSWEVVISIMTWDGEYVSQLVVSEGTKDYDYTLDYDTVCPRDSDYRHARRADDRVLDQAGHENSLGGICVDKERAISISKPDKDVIDVYDSKFRHYCTIGNKERPKLKEPRGLSLLPDGRMLVCDTGNKRLLVI